MEYPLKYSCFNNKRYYKKLYSWLTGYSNTIGSRCAETQYNNFFYRGINVLDTMRVLQRFTDKISV